jgi:hypothetical protein
VIEVGTVIEIWEKMLPVNEEPVTLAVPEPELIAV